MTDSLWLDGITCVLAALWWIQVPLVWRGSKYLDLPGDGTAGPDPEEWPLVSIVVPCRDEVYRIRDAVTSLFEVDYPRREIIVVDDRSRDGTSEILDDLAKAHEDLRVVRVGELPDGWLGKCHALSMGAKEATGEWILFTDGDVWHAPRALRKTVAFAEERRLDLLSLFPVNEGATATLESYLTTFLVGAVLILGYWAATARRPSLLAAGSGAFLLVRRAVYGAAGGHDPLKLAVIDDVYLARHIRRRGYRTEFRFARDALSLPFVCTWRDFLRVTEKNAFALMEYSWIRVLGLTAFSLTFGVLAPLCFLIDVRLWPAALAAWVAMGLGYLRMAPRVPAPAWGFLLYPVLTVLGLLPIYNSALSFVRHGGVKWRGRTYRAAELRAFERRWRRGS